MDRTGQTSRLRENAVPTVFELPHHLVSSQSLHITSMYQCTHLACICDLNDTEKYNNYPYITVVEINNLLALSKLSLLLTISRAHGPTHNACRVSCKSCLWYLKEHTQRNIGLKSFIVVIRYIVF